ncbi:hypothetical protein CDD80_7381 [Ophiocordyceps camponoti-rufipedis]|uniref:Uncharacterized protein n=1 Tax=Ophiocordyceps camponoti-rufipedis TaxID=2004952 RepID=A0A2C5YLP3_9HYPO|nr:hypothetical protein CDD80_7381 [Ophiocordyceps camponoti-rufipedis]
MKFLAVCAFLTAVAQAAPILTTTSPSALGGGAEDGKLLGVLKARQAGDSKMQPSKKASKKGKLPGGLLKKRQQMPDLLGSGQTSDLLSGLQARHEDQDDSDDGGSEAEGPIEELVEGLVSRRASGEDEQDLEEEPQEEDEEDTEEPLSAEKLLMARGLENLTDGIAEDLDENDRADEDE